MSSKRSNPKGKNTQKTTDSDTSDFRFGRSKNPFDETTDDFEQTTDDSTGIERNTDFSMKILYEFDESEVDGSAKSHKDLPHFNLPALDKAEMETFFQHPAIKTAFEEGVNLKDHRNQISDELLATEKLSLAEYVEQQANICELYNNLDQCDKILTNMAVLLNGYEETLSSKLRDIHQMQTLANEQIAKQENLAKISEDLSKFVNEIYLPDNLTRAIARSKINQTYVHYLEAFDAKISFLEAMVDRDVLAVKEQKQVVKDLVIRAVDKIKAWLVEKITPIKSLAALRKRQKPLLKYCSCFGFLRRFNSVAAAEVSVQYAEIASKVYLSYFSSMIDSFSKIQIEAASKNDLLGEPEATTWSFFGPKITPLKQRAPVFSLTQRMECISNLADPVPIPGPESTQKFSFEFLFRVLNYTILTCIKEEYNFSKSFFLADFTGQIFTKTVGLFTNNLKSFCSTSYDAVGLMIIQCVLHDYKQIVTSVHDPLIFEYFDGASKLLRSQFDVILEQHRLSLTTVEVEDLGDINCQAHYITRRYAEFLVSLLILSKKFPDAVKSWDIQARLQTLREAVSPLLGRLSGLLKEEQRKLFLINNYDVIVGVALERDVASPETDFIEKELTQLSDQYALDQLQKSFPKLISFMTQHTVVDSVTGKVRLKDTNCPVKIVEDTLKAFSENGYWKKSVETINNDIMKSFSNFERGVKIFHSFLGALSNHFQNLLEIIKTDFKKLQEHPNYISPPVFKTEVAAAMRGLNLF